jgi:hypothetical protein
MRIRFRRSNDTRYSKPLFVRVNKFDTDSFLVRVRYPRLAQTKMPRTASGSQQPWIAPNPATSTARKDQPN